MIKLYNKHVKFTLHPCSMDGANTPIEEILRKFGFLNINTALANTVQNTQGPIVSSSSKKDVSCKELTAIIKEKINEEH